MNHALKFLESVSFRLQIDSPGGGLPGNPPMRSTLMAGVSVLSWEGARRVGLVYDSNWRCLKDSK